MFFYTRSFFRVKGTGSVDASKCLSRNICYQGQSALSSTNFISQLLDAPASINPSPSTNSVDEPVSTVSPTINICPNARKNLYSSMLLLNAQSINPSAPSKSKWKVRAIQSIIIEEKAKNHSIPFIGITESWLKSYISDAQVNIPGYIVSRSDRSGRLGRGALLYSHINLPISETLTFDDKICEAVL